MTEYVVWGPPGTGKTSFLSKQVRRAVEQYGPDDVIVSSFTRAAAVELGGRGLPLPDSHIGTLHALCYRALGSPTIAETKVKEFNDWQSVYHLDDVKMDLDEPEQKFSTKDDTLLAEMNVLRARMIPESSWPIHIAAFQKQWENWKYESGYIDFTDMIEQSIMRAVGPPFGASVGFFDEVQDFTPLELSLIRLWSSQMKTAVLAGDDDQTLYQFKGADPHAIAHGEVPSERRVLSQSYRMPQIVHTYSQRWIAQIGEREQKEFNPRPESAGSLLVDPSLRYSDAPLVVDRIVDMIGEEQTAMVIGACSYMLSPIIRELRQRSLTFHNPYRKKRGDWNPIQASRQGATAMRDRLGAFMRRGHEHESWTYAELRQWTPLIKRAGSIKRGTQPLIDAGAQDEFVSMDRLMDIFEPEALRAARYTDWEWLRAHVLATKARAIKYPIQVGLTHGFDELWKVPRIVVGTIHSVKGGEADNVLLFPDISNAGMAEYMHPKLRENTIRQFYVGMTRARENVVLCRPSSYTRVDWL